MKIFKEEIERRRAEKREKRSGTWSGLLIKIAIFIMLLFLIKFLLSPAGDKFGDYWQTLFKKSGQELRN